MKRQVEKFIQIAIENNLDFTNTKKYITKNKLWDEFNLIHEKVKMHKMQGANSHEFVIDGISKSAYILISKVLKHRANKQWAPEIL